MSIDNLATVSSIIPSRRTPAVSTPGASAENVDSPDSSTLIADTTRQNVAVNGKDVPVNPNTDDREADNKENRLDSAVSHINSYVQNLDRKLEFTVNESLPLGRSVIKVIDSETDKVIREIPSEEAVELAARIREQFEDDQKVEGLILVDQA